MMIDYEIQAATVLDLCQKGCSNWKMEQKLMIYLRALFYNSINELK